MLLVFDVYIIGWRDLDAIHRLSEVVWIVHQVGKTVKNHSTGFSVDRFESIWRSDLPTH